MFVLALDASCPRSAIAVGTLGDPEPLAGDMRVDGANQASTTLIARLEAVLSAAGIQASEIGRVACGVGPGTFTGTRVAVATAKGFALGLGLVPDEATGPNAEVGVAAVSTLLSVAFSASSGPPVAAVLDARRGEVYAAAVGTRDGDHWIMTPRCAPWNEVRAELRRAGHGSIPVVGPGVEAVQALDDAVQPSTAEALPGPTVLGLWRASTSALARLTTADDVAANYLRKTYAEMGINKPKRPVFRNPLLDAE